MSVFKFACPHCGQHFAGDESYRGRQIQCLACGGAILVPQAQAASPATGQPQPVVKASQTAVTSAGGPPAYVWICLFFLSWVPCGVTVLWQHLQRQQMMRNSYRRASSPGGAELPIPAPSSWASQENLFHWIGFGLCAVLACLIVAWEPRLRRRPLIQLALVSGCLAAAWSVNQLPGGAYRSTETFLAKQIVADTTGAPDAYVQSPSINSPVAKLRVQNPPQAITFVLELKKSLAELYEEQKYFKNGVARISFDTDDKAQLVSTLMAQARSGAMGSWANAATTIGNAKRHVISTQLLRVQGPSGALRPANHQMDMQRGKAEGKQILLTLKYSELGFMPGQTVRVAVLDEGASVGSGGGEPLPSFQLVLK
jgi:DNA-directed RNA polymerase subunit RPC12/RpoP